MTQVNTRSAQLPKGAVKVTRSVVAMLQELEQVREVMNNAKRVSDALRKQILDEVGKGNLTLVHANAIVGSVSVDSTLQVSKEKLQLLHPEIFNTLAEPSERVTLKVTI